MSNRRKPKTEGLTWLEHSISAFNGSGYADYDSPEAYLDCYIDYQRWKKNPQGAKLATEYYHAVIPLVEHIVNNGHRGGHTPSDYAINKFSVFRIKKNRPSLL